MYKQLLVSTDIHIRDGCTISHTVHGSGVTEFLLKDKDQTVGLEIESEVLRVFLKEATTALAEMDGRFEREEAARGVG